MPVPWAAIAAGAQLAGTAASMFGAKKGASAAKQARRRQREYLLEAGREELRAMEQDRDRLIGAQRAGYAASGVAVDRGTTALLVRETEEEFRRAQQTAASRYVAEREGMQAPGVDWWSHAASITQGVANLGMSWGK